MALVELLNGQKMIQFGTLSGIDDRGQKEEALGFGTVLDCVRNPDTQKLVQGNSNGFNTHFQFLDCVLVFVKLGHLGRDAQAAKLVGQLETPAPALLDNKHVRTHAVLKHAVANTR